MNNITFAEFRDDLYEAAYLYRNYLNGNYLNGSNDDESLCY